MESNFDSTQELREIHTYKFTELAHELPHANIDSITEFRHPNVIAPHEVESTIDDQYLVITDRFDNSIKLYNYKEEYLTSIGGLTRSTHDRRVGGKRIHIGVDNNLYVLNLGSQRITRFQINNDSFTYKTSFTPSSSINPAIQLKSIYVTKWGNFGVFRAILDYKKGIEEFQLYELDKKFRAIKKLLSIPANEKIILDRWTHVDHPLGQKMFWDFDGDSFYYLSSHSTVVNKYNVNSNSLHSYEFFRLIDRQLDEENKLKFMESVAHAIGHPDKIHKAIVEKEILPHFEGFTVLNKYYYFEIFTDYSANHTELVRINSESGQIQYMNIPMHLWNVKATNNKLYGLDSSGENSQLRIIHFKE